MATIEEVLNQIDAALDLWLKHRSNSKYDDLSDLPDRPIFTEVNTILAATLDRLAPPNSPYRAAITQIIANKVGALRALRRDYEAGHLASVQTLVRAEVFADFLEMSEHLLEQGYKDPAAVVVGSVLENHLRAICQSRGLSAVINEKPKKADLINNELAAAGVYSKLDQKNVTAWLALRNKAAHGHYTEYNSDQVRVLLSGVSEFVARVVA